jgi:hypothetical protein
MTAIAVAATSFRLSNSLEALLASFILILYNEGHETINQFISSNHVQTLWTLCIVDVSIERRKK